jgi:hypothetical protein
MPLTTRQRNALPRSAFALKSGPRSNWRYPAPTKAQARKAGISEASRARTHKWWQEPTKYQSHASREWWYWHCSDCGETLQSTDLEELLSRRHVRCDEQVANHRSEILRRRFVT